MKILNIKAKNFGSYKDVEFDYSNQGLCLISGPTGAGKSTIQDLVIWTLFGVTAKDGSVDEVRNWYNRDEKTTSIASIQLKNNSVLSITRIRGKSNENDLYWTFNIQGSLEKNRGKDLQDSQKQIEDLLGVSKELYLTAGSYNEFSPTGSFFTDKAKDRRELLEKIANLQFPIKLSGKISEKRKLVKDSISDTIMEQKQLQAQTNTLLRTSETALKSANKWKEDRAAQIKELQVKKDNFDLEKKSKLDTLALKIKTYQEFTDKEVQKLLVKLHKIHAQFFEDNKCQKCGHIKDTLKQDYKVLENDIQNQILTLRQRENPFKIQYTNMEMVSNTYEEQLYKVNNQNNPYEHIIIQHRNELSDCLKKRDELEKTYKELEHLNNSLDQLYSLCGNLRAILLKKAINTVNVLTNRYLDTYFYSKIRVSLELTNTDNLEVIIYENGHECTYTQLSKGQRGLLKLCFAVAIMETAANEAGIHFDTLMFDESLDGLDVDLKIKAFSLFVELEKSHSTILVIDHASELKDMFSKQFSVQLVNDSSIIKEV